MDDGEGIGSGEKGGGGLESGSGMYSQSPVGVVMDRVMPIFWRWGQSGGEEGVVGEEVLRDEAGWLKILLPLLSFLFIPTHSSASCSDEGQRMQGESTMSPTSIR